MWWPKNLPAYYTHTHIHIDQRDTHKHTSQKNEISLFLHIVASVHSSKRILNTDMKNYGSSNNTYISIAQ